MADQIPKNLKNDFLPDEKNKQKIKDKRESIDTEPQVSDDEDEPRDEDSINDENQSQETGEKEETEDGSVIEEESDVNVGNRSNSEKILESAVERRKPAYLNESPGPQDNSGKTESLFIPSSLPNNTEPKIFPGKESSFSSPIPSINATPKYVPVESRKALPRRGVPGVHKDEEKTTSNWLTLLIIIGIVIAIISGLGKSYYDKLTVKSTEFKCTADSNCNKLFLEEMGKKYPKQQLASFKVYARLVDLAAKGSRPEDINVVYTLLYNETHRTAYLIAKDMAFFAAEKFNKPSRIIEHYGSDYSSDFTSSSSMKELTEELMENGAMVVYDFDKISTDKVRKFHAICDKYTPFVNNQMAYILVLKTPRLNHTIDLSDRDLIMLAGSRMEELWSDMEDTSLKPLIVRLTENIIQIKS